MAYQIIRSGSSVGAHYREGMRSRSDAELISKFEGALMELEEAAYWLSIVVELEMVSARKLAPLQREAGELTAIFVACREEAEIPPELSSSLILHPSSFPPRPL